MECGGDELFVLGKGAIELAKIHIHKIGNPYAPACDFILITRADAARSSANRDAVVAAFRNLLKRAVKRKDDMRTVADLELRFDVDSNRFKAGDLFEQCRRSYDNSVADHGKNTRAENAAGNQFQNEFSFADEDGVAGVVAALVTGDRGKSFGEQIDDFALALIAPLRPQHYQITHANCEPTPKVFDCTDVTLDTMQMCGVFQALGPEIFHQ